MFEYKGVKYGTFVMRQEAMWMTHVYQWAGGLLWLGHGRWQSVWALFSLVQEWIGSSRACGLLGVEIAPEGILGSDPCVRISDHMFVCWNIITYDIDHKELLVINLGVGKTGVCDLIMGKDGRPDPWMMDQGV
ncbi:hypothetical protein Bca52824_073471 [Brassica carinata]|uniref:Uncharacterized protein n=1 Tax=Brassica carinata TaxID=52824 RepID=A0A8X7QAA5_BRACI|nr:hypothetical protein Bca52824_073471 [Brassica carinata]